MTLSFLLTNLHVLQNQQNKAKLQKSVKKLKQNHHCTCDACVTKVVKNRSYYIFNNSLFL